MRFSRTRRRSILIAFATLLAVHLSASSPVRIAQFLASLKDPSGVVILKAEHSISMRFEKKSIAPIDLEDLGLAPSAIIGDEKEGIYIYNFYTNQITKPKRLLFSIKAKVANGFVTEIGAPDVLSEIVPPEMLQAYLAYLGASTVDLTRGALQPPAAFKFPRHRFPTLSEVRSIFPEMKESPERVLVRTRLDFHLSREDGRESKIVCLGEYRSGSGTFLRGRIIAGLLTMEFDDRGMNLKPASRPMP